MNETINGLHSCKPENEPVQGETKLFTIEHRPAKNGKKAWIKIKSAGADYGGTPYRILSAEPTGYTDAHGNISFNLEIEPAVQPNDDETQVYRRGELQKAAANAPQTPPARQNGLDGVREAREHIMQSANLYVLCVNAVNSYCAAHFPEVAQTSEMFQAATGTLFIEASRAGFVDKMPKSPIK